MKKSALLAVSALSLGLVGLSTFVPVANAAYSASGDAEVKVVVNEAFGIGTAEVKDEDASAWEATTANVDFGTIGVNAIASDVEKTIYTLNNSGSPATLTLADNDTVTALVDGTKKIETGTGVAAGTSAWGVKLPSKSDYSMMPAKGETGLTVGTNASGSESSKSFTVIYGVSTSATQAAGTYTDTVTYSFTK